MKKSLISLTVLLILIYFCIVINCGKKPTAPDTEPEIKEKTANVILLGSPTVDGFMFENNGQWNSGFSVDGEVKNIGSGNAYHVTVMYTQQLVNGAISDSIKTIPFTIAPNATASFNKVYNNTSSPTSNSQYEITWDNMVESNSINETPTKPNNPFPSDGSINQKINPKLSWSCVDPDEDPISYKIYLGEADNLELICSGINTTSFEPNELLLNKKYSWKVIANDDNGHEISSDLWSFTTEKSITWKNTIGGSREECGLSVRVNNQNKIITLGYTYSYGSGKQDIYLTQLNEYGEQEWTKYHGGSSWDQGDHLEIASDGGCIIVGHTKSFGTGEKNLYMLKTNFAGDEEWYKTFGESGYNEGKCVKNTMDGGFIITGFCYPAGAWYDMWVIKTDAAGEKMWEKKIGGDKLEIGFSITQTIDNGYAVLGYTESFGNGGADMYLVRLDADGAILWSRTFGGSNSDIGYCIQQTSDGGFVLLGETSSFGNGGKDIYLVKTNQNGDQEWSKTFGYSGNDYAGEVQITQDGCYIICGTSSANFMNAYFFKTDENGNEIWSHTFEDFGASTGESVTLFNDGGYIITGSSSFGEGNILLIKTDPEGIINLY